MGSHHLPSITQTPSNKAVEGISALSDHAITQHMKGTERPEHTSQYSETLKNLQFRSVSTTSSQSHRTAANDACPQAENHNHLKAALTRYVKRKDNTPIPLGDYYKVLLNNFQRILPEMDLSKLDNKDFEMALSLPNFSLDKIPVDRRTKTTVRHRLLKKFR